MLKTIDRLWQFIQYAGLSARQFDLSIGASNGYTLRMKKNHASIGSDVIETILRTYPQLNVVWLLTGEGEMLLPEKQPAFASYEQLPSEKQAEIERLIEQKVKERQDEQLQFLLKEVTREIEKNQGKK
ncbi:hypothetical protein PP178_08430 [Zeaxanthinibacter sp. PT1]|uniref:hypothetical protein n=1 Tax=Zeaxanthinibacter TaxID=561554 RepID=UPI0023492C00|nr:hypothetical protein [Zeaxanthinibacter sp. PT1]MDC6351580.1 hypothetical protein [Zeaxanthinibacter sp. PT1]